ncbi:MAG: ATP-binding protein [Anaerolineae bacterium]|nr:MAG: ATP-binding protein [Anaerolineae bacterium]
MSNRYRLTRAAELESLTIFREFIANACREQGVDDDTTFGLRLAVDEACTNIIQHGYAGMDPGSIILDLRFEVDKVVVDLTDFGRAFEPAEPERPDLTAPAEERKEGGLGLFLIYETMDRIDYRVAPEGNILTFTKML